jgi:hypothetical protein
LGNGADAYFDPQWRRAQALFCAEARENATTPHLSAQEAILSCAPLSHHEEAHATKCVIVRIHHSTHPPYKLKLHTGTKVSDVLSYLNLTEDFVISPLSDPQKHFTSEEEIYGEIANDEKLIATLSPQAAEKYAHSFMQ